MDTLRRMSLNQLTIRHVDLAAAVDACVRHGIPAMGIWRRKVAEVGLDRAVRLVRDAGLKVSSLEYGVLGPGAAAERRRQLDENRRALEEAAALQADMYLVNCGTAVGRDLDGARAAFAEGLAALEPHARACGVRLGIEPLHPMYAAEISALVTLGQALDLCAPFDPASVGVLIDTYHVWWDPQVYAQIERARGRIAGVHVDDYAPNPSERVYGRVLMGDGVIDVRRIREAIDATGYDGFIEAEVLNKQFWERPVDELLQQLCDSFRAYV